MKRILIGALVISCAMVMAAGAATKAAVHHAGAAKSVTGCLEKGDEANTFKLTNVTGGGDWELVGAPAALKMSEHVGHKVEVSGTSLTAGAAEAVEHHAMGAKKETKAEAKMEKKEEKGEKGEHHLKVAAVKMISSTCP
ncbi:MAG TPA: hypothetical protein VFS78_17455 [Vicinamibacteria bacterium]|nr:hypothetical protein [Vicinamibacteria bacterium]